MYENKMTKTFRNRRDLLRGSFPSAHQFLIQLETQSAPVVWLNSSSNTAVYWQDGFMAYVKFIDIGEVNTGICLTPKASSLAEGTENRSFLLFPDAIERLLRQHGGFRHRWAVKTGDGGFELRHPAPSPFFRDLVALVERMGAQHRAACNAQALEAELQLSQPELSHAPAAARPLPPPRPAEKTPAKTRLVAQVAAREAVAVSGASKPPVERPMLIPRRKLRVRESARPLNPRDTQRFLTFEHLVDAYFDYAMHDDGDPLEDYYTQRLEGLESLFLCRLPRPGRGSRAASSDRGQVVELAWRCVRLANSLESPFLAPVTGPVQTMIRTLWEEHGSHLGTPVEELRRSCRSTFKTALLSLFPGISDTVVGEVDLVDLGVPTDPPDQV
jgi:hypothetical protein